MVYLKEEAKKRQSHGMTAPGKSLPRKTVEASGGGANESAVQAGKLVGVSKDSIRDADFVVKNDPELAQQVRDSKVTVSAAAKRIREALNPKPEPTPEEQAEKQARVVLKNPENISKMTAEIITEYFGGKITW